LIAHNKNRINVDVFLFCSVFKVHFQARIKLYKISIHLSTIISASSSDASLNHCKNLILPINFV